VTTVRDLPRAASAAGGALLAGGTRGVASLRQARKPLHPDGELRTGRIHRHGSGVVTGVAWLDEAGQDDVVVRRSRAIGLPLRLPDIHGLALRVFGDDGDGDILFATTGLGRISRFVLTPSRDSRRRPLTTLLPYDTDAGALVLAAVAVGTDSYSLSWARPLGEWHQFGALLLSGVSEDPGIAFDPVRHQVKGLRQYPSVSRLREPSYLSARRSRTTPAAR
jgi:hypothetical protein